ncbi:trace amine-associated receptor 1-like [Aulostomus maculatus]
MEELCFPQLNTSCVKPKRPYSVIVLCYVLVSIISLLTAVLNLMVIISISHFKQLHTPTNLLLLSLAVSDFFVGLLLSFYSLSSEGCWILGDFMCAVFYFLDYLVISASVGNMVLISIDRYLTICDPLHYHTKVSHKRVQTCICFCWICSLLYLIGVMKEMLVHPGKYNSCAGECVFHFSFIANVVDLILTLILPISVIVVLYMRIFVVAVSQARAMRSHFAAVTMRRSGTVTVQKSELKAARSVSVVVLVFLICLCPYFCYILAGTDTLLDATSGFFVVYLFYFNSCLNPLIYAFFYPWFRKSVKLIVSLQILKPGSCNTKLF